MYILGIETTCDETAASVVLDGKTILSNVILSQTQHEHFGGVFPEIAARAHADAIIPVVDRALKEAKLSCQDIDAIAVAAAPGLLGSLMVGVESAKALAYAWKKPLIPVHHIEAHLYAAIMQNKNPLFPAIGAVFSGGHSLLLAIEDIGSYTMIGTTIDDALGEAFDKVARLMDIGYPGGAKLEKLATKGNPDAFPFKAGQSKLNPYHFSFSGLKTQLFYAKERLAPLSEAQKADLAASFQKAALFDVVKKSHKACLEYGANGFYLGGGVAQNKTLQHLLKEKLSTPLFVPPGELCTDNAAMIAALAYHKKPIHPEIEEFFSLEPRPTDRFCLSF